jgi:hypothetical protein
MSEFEYYLKKVEEMLAMASTSSVPKARAEFERLAEEYKVLALNAQKQNQSKRA